jgi:hypothetical protein
MNGLLFFTGGIILWGGEYTSPGEKGEKEKYKIHLAQRLKRKGEIQNTPRPEKKEKRRNTKNAQHYSFPLLVLCDAFIFSRRPSCFNAKGY